jgi:hypothetical protein
VEDYSALLNVVYLERKKCRVFENCERMVVELKAFFFKTLYQWTNAYDCLHISSFPDFFFICFSLSG